MIDTNELRMLMQDFKLAGSPMFVQTAQMGELLDRLEAAEKELAELRSSMKFRTSLIGRTEAERDALRAEIEELHVLISAVKKQADAEFRIRVKKEEEYARLCAKIEGGSTTVIVSKFPVNPTDAPLYVLPGAQTQGEEE